MKRSIVLILSLMLMAFLPGCGPGVPPSPALPEPAYVPSGENGAPMSAGAAVTGGEYPLSYLVNAWDDAETYSFTQEYYVSSSTGDDGNDGTTPETAFKTLARLGRVKLAPGTGVFLKRGDVFEESAMLRGSGTADQPIVLTGYGEGPRPRIESPRHGLYFLNASGWTIDGIAVRLTATDPLTSGAEVRRAIVFEYSGDPAARYSAIRVRNCEIFGDGYNYNTQGIILLAAYRGGEFAEISDVAIENNILHHIGWLGAATISWDSALAAQYAVPGVYRDVAIDGNYFHHIGHTAAYTHAVGGGSFSRNYGHDIGVYDGLEPIDWGLCGFMTIGCDDFDIAFNEIHGVLDADVGYDGVALDVDWSSTRVRVAHNHCYDCYGAGISAMASRDCVLLMNRVGGNKVKTYAPRGQITLTDFTGDQNPDRITGIINYRVSDNLLTVDVPDTCAFGAMVVRRGDAWTGNEFTGNRILLKTTDGTRMISLFTGAVFDRVDGNLYFTDGTFKAVDETVHLRAYDLTAWQAAGYDLGSRLAAPDTTPPADVAGLTATVRDGQVFVCWQPSQDPESGIWHYNVHLAGGDVPYPIYPNLLTETAELSFTFDLPVRPGRYTVIVTAENNMGVLSERGTAASFDVP